MTNKHKTYTPSERTGYAPKAHSLESLGSKNQGSTSLPNTVTDDIAVNNIVTAEFDYTEHNDVDKDLNVNP
ncbi:hypothetical protein JCM1393_07920 [Clostridium carnis]